MSRRTPLTALVAAIALLGALLGCEVVVGDGSRTQQLRAADQEAVLSTSLRARSATMRRDRAEPGSHAALAPTSFTLVPPARAAVDSSLPEPAARGPFRDERSPRSRGPPRA